MANLVPVRKKSGDIRICIDFKNLNRASLKDNYPIPTMEQILQSVAGSAMLSLLDGFSGYNQVLVSKEDHLKTTFRTKWGTYAYDKMPFGLINVGATFQRAMDIAFRGLINKSVVVYLDDIMVYSKIRKEHIPHLKAIFERCRRYGISLNPKKSIFAMEEGTLLRFVISPEGITIDPGRVEAIKAIVLPHNKKAMQSFLGKINFVRRFISEFSEIVKPLQEMIKKDSNFKWTKDRKVAFEKIKESISPTLQSPNFDNEFIIYTFTSDHSIVVVLTQKNEDREEFPVSFMSIGLQEAELKYPAIKKQSFTVFKAIKNFRPYLLRSHTKIIVPHTAIRALLIQKEPGDRRGNWLTTSKEYDLEIKLAKLVKGQGLCKLTEESQDPQMEQEEGWENEVDLMYNEVLYMLASTNSWYNDMKYYLTHASGPNHLDACKKRDLRLNFSQYQLIDGVLFRHNYDQILLRFLEKDDAKNILTELHDGP